MSQKQNKTLRYVKLINVVIALSIFLISIGALFFNGDNKKEDRVEVNVYFLNANANKLEPEKRSILKADKVAMMGSLLNELLTGPKEAGLIKSIPESISLTEVKITADNIAELQLSEQYKDLAPQEELFCRAALVWTLTELDFIKSVHIYIGNEELLKLNGQPMGLLNRENVIITADIPSSNTDKKKINLYFADENAMGLVMETREIDYDPNEPLERYIMQELIKGPQIQGAFRTIAAETGVYDVTTNEGVCYLDLNMDFMNKFQGGSSSEELMLYSIVNTLTEMKTIKKVQFLIEGNKVTEFKGHGFDISKPLERREDLINK